MMTSPALVRRVLAPDGTVLTLANLPPPDAQRWVASRKAVVVAAVRGGLLSMSDACARYRLTTEGFLGWQTQGDRNGLRGLRATRIQEYREGGRRTGVHDAHRPSPWSARRRDATVLQTSLSMLRDTRADCRSARRGQCRNKFDWFVADRNLLRQIQRPA